VIEEVVQHSPDRTKRIVRRQRTKFYKSYVVERLVDGTWERTPNGPWDYLSNARDELRSLL